MREPPALGRQLAGIAASTAQQRMAARFVLADVPLKQFLDEALIPYEDDEVTRLIIDSHDAAAFAPVAASRPSASFATGCCRTGHPGGSGRAGARPHPGDGRGGQQADAQSGSDPGGHENAGS